MFSIKEELETKKNPSPQSTSEIELLNIADEEPSTKSKEEKEEGLGKIVVSDIISSNILEEVLEEKEKALLKNNTQESGEKNIVKNPFEEISQGKNLEIGKRQKNIMKKSAELTKIELLDLTKCLLDISKIDIETKSLISKFSEKYINYKYFFEGDFNKEYQKTDIQNIIRKEIETLAEEISKTKKYSNKSINKIKMTFLTINDIDFSEVAIAKSLKENNITIELAPGVKKIIMNYNRLYNQFLKKLDNRTFHLILTRYGLTDNYISNVRANIKFNSIFSKEGIEKAFHAELVVEDLKNIQLKLLSIKAFEDWLNFSLKQNYMIYLPESLYKKSRKLYNILSSIDDSYSQNKILFIINYNILLNYEKIIKYLKKKGYHFVLDCNIKEIKENEKNINKQLCLFDNVYISGADTKEKIPLLETIEKNIIYTEESFFDLEGGIIT